MVKTGVVDGVVKTASADNENDPIGTAAKCIADAGEAAASVAKVAAGFTDAGKPDKPEKPKED
jgi:hypothetical protein